MASESEIKELIAGLNSLHDGEAALGRIILIGPAAIPFLLNFLMRGAPSGVYEPRRWAVEGLGALGAKDALVEYLSSDREIPDAVIRAGEDAVVSAAARELARWRTEDVFDLLTDLARRRRTPGVVEALASFEREESIPLLDRALEDGLARAAAEDGFRRLGRRASRALVLSATTPLPDIEDESPSSRVRRASAARLLLDTGVNEDDWPALASLLDEADPHIVMAAALIALRIAPPSSRRDAGRAVMRILPDAPWDVRLEAGDVLGALLPDLHAEIEAAVEARRSAAGAAFDRVLPVLLHALRSAGPR